MSGLVFIAAAMLAQAAPVPIQREGIPPKLRVPILKPPPRSDPRVTIQPTLTPVQTREFFKRTYKSPDNDPYWPCGAGQYDLSIPESPQKVLTVGYKHYYDAGTKPFPCTTRVVEVHRGGARFDLASVFNSGVWLNKPDTVVERALLTFRREQLVGGRDCNDQVTTSAEGWPTSGDWLGGKPWIRAFPVPRDDSFACAGFGNICEIDVTAVVNEWARGARPNNGFIFVGENEDMGARGNSVCKTRYSDFALQTRISYIFRP